MCACLPLFVCVRVSTVVVRRAQKDAQDAATAALIQAQEEQAETRKRLMAEREVRCAEYRMTLVKLY